MKKLILLLLAACLVGVGLAVWKIGKGDNSVQVLETGTAERAPVRKTLEATGIIKSQVGAIVKIGARATGRIDKMLVKVGDKVKRGQLVAAIDDREIKDSITESGARLEADKAELERVRAVYPLNIREAESNAAVAEAEAEYARSFLQRQKELYGQGLIARDTLDNAEQQAKVKEGLLDARLATLNRTRTEYEKELKKAEKSVAEAQAALSALETRLSYTRIYSPIDGVVSQVTVQEGETAVAGLQVVNLITVLDPTRLEMWIYVDETDVGQIAPGLPVEFSVDAHPDKTFEGAINEIYPEPDIRDNIVYYRALVRLDKDQAEYLRPEMTTQCRIVVLVKDDVLSIPNTALKWVGGEQVVYKVDQRGDATRVKVELGLHGRLRSEVFSGLSEGDKVAVKLILPSSDLAGGR